MLVVFMALLAVASAWVVNNPFRTRAPMREATPAIEPLTRLGLHHHVAEEWVKQYVDTAEEVWRAELQPSFNCVGPSCPPMPKPQPWVQPTADDGF